jgi:hypothetical protein
VLNELKILDFILPFFIEMFFGKRGETTTKQPNQKLKKTIGYILISASISINCFAISKLYSLSLKYISLEHEKSTLESKDAQCKELAIKSEQIQETLNYCIKSSTQKRK